MASSPEAAELSVTFEHLKQVSSELKGYQDQIAAKLALLNTNLLELAGQWDGTSKESFQTVHSQWHTGALGLLDTLADLRRAVDFANDAHGTAGDELISLWREH